MMNKMFCFQCEQTAKGTGCTGEGGVCGKRHETAKLQDRLTGALISLATTAKAASEYVNVSTDTLIITSLFTTVTNVSFNDKTISILLGRIYLEHARLAKESGMASEAFNYDFDMSRVWTDDEDIRSLKSLILFGLKGMAAYAYHANVFGYTDSDVTAFFYEALRAIGEDHTMEELLPLVLKTGGINLKCMALLDKANTESLGIPKPTIVPLKVEKGPFIVVTGHDLSDMKTLLEQTDGKGVNVYTHGEMLPAHSYPELKKHEQLKGNFGTAWQNQTKEFADIPAPVLFTTNCLMPPRDSYADRVFTTGVVSYPGTAHIGEDKDFTPVIDKAVELKGYDDDKQFTGINGGAAVATGFSHKAVLPLADKITEAVKSGQVRHFFLVGGCDGAKPGRNYYTDFVRLAPKDTVILTLACGKYRFNDMDLGTVAGLPRLMDMGQCNDAYSAIKVAKALATALSCTVNELPLSMVLSWYEQKAVSVLLTLLHLGIKNILLGPTLPAFVSPAVLKYLSYQYGIAQTTTPEEDLKKLLG